MMRKKWVIYKEVDDNVGDKQECDSDSSDDPHCFNESLSDDDNKPKISEFREKDMKNSQLQLGMIFLNVKVFRSFLREYHIIEGYVFKFVKNESSRVIVVCSDNNCAFRLHASPMSNQSKFISNKEYQWASYLCEKIHEQACNIDMFFK